MRKVKIVASAALSVALVSLHVATLDRVNADVITVTVPGCVVSPDDLLGWWKGEDDALASVGPDLGGNVDFADAFFGRGFQFSGTNVFGTTSLGTTTSGVTVEAWIRPVTSTGAQTVMGRWDFPSADDSARGYALMVSGTDLLWMTDDQSARRPMEVRTPVPELFDGGFHHVAATWSPSEVAIYVDGAQRLSVLSQGGSLNAASQVPFRVGSLVGIGDPLAFRGTIDEPAVYRRALSAAEVQLVVDAGPNAKCVFAAGAGVLGPGLALPADRGGADPVVSADGRYVLFRSSSSDLVPVVNDPLLQTTGTDYDQIDNFRDDVLLLDTGATSTLTDDTVELVSVDSNGRGGGLASEMGRMTPTASHIVFASSANDLVSGDTIGGRDVFLRNRAAGTTERVSVRSDGSQPQLTATGVNNDNRNPSINDAGTVVAFESTNRGLAPEAFPVPGDTWQTYDIYVRDLSSPNPALRTTTRITVGTTGEKANGSSSSPIVSADGRDVWFTSAASNLVAGDTNNRVDLFRHDRLTATTTRVDLTAATGQPLNGDISLADVSPDGRWVAFSTNASTVVAVDTNQQVDAFRFDTVTGAVVKASPAVFPSGNGPSFATAISDDGTQLVFHSDASNFVEGDTNAQTDVFITDLARQTTQRVSLQANGAQRTGVSQGAVATSTAREVYYVTLELGAGITTIWRSDLALPN
ncbi:MAG: LamG-like jellyroll fold domain-containing protein [Ilumatobacteraceae bacterium]